MFHTNALWIQLGPGKVLGGWTETNTERSKVTDPLKEGEIMAISSNEVSNEQVLQQVKTLSTGLQELKSSLARIESSVAIIRSEVKELPTGLKWASEERK